MTYYSLRPSTDELEIGQYPQIEKSLSYDYASPSCFWNVQWDEEPAFMPTYRARLAEGAILTNMLETLPGFYGLCVDDKLKRIFQSLNLPKHQFYSAKIENGDEEISYSWFHFIDSLIPFVDWKSTEFELYKKQKFEILNEFTVESLFDLREIKRGVNLNHEKGVRIKQITLNNTFPMYDVISLWGLAPMFLASERLINELIKMNIKGVEYSLFDKLYIR